MLRQPGITGMMVALFLSGGIEGSMFTWLPYFATEHLRLEHANLNADSISAGVYPGSISLQRYC